MEEKAKFGFSMLVTVRGLPLLLAGAGDANSGRASAILLFVGDD